MAQWRLRNPATFPLIYHTTMERPIGTWVLFADESAQKVLWHQEMWRLFQYSLRNHTNHPSCVLLRNGLSRRSKVWHDPERMIWVLSIVVAESKNMRWLNAEMPDPDS